MTKNPSLLGVLGRLMAVLILAVLFLTGCEWLSALFGGEEDDQSEEEPASAWSKTYGHGETYTEYHAYGFDAVTGGGYVFAAQNVYNGAGGYDVWVVRLDPDGGLVWEQGFGGAQEEEAFAVRQVSDGGFIVVGESWSFRTGGSNCDAWVLKLDEDGGVEWQRSYGDTGVDVFHDVQETATGFLLCGNTTSFGSGGYDLWLVEIDGSGGVLYEARLGGSQNEFGRAAVPTPDGGCILVADTQSFGAGSRDAWLVKLDEDHEVEWETAYGGGGVDFPRCVVRCDDGGYVVAAYTDSFGAGDEDFWVLKVDDGGNPVWQYTYGGPEPEIAHDLQKTGDGGYVLTGWTYSFGAEENDAWIVKLDGAGLIEWQKRYNIIHRDGADAWGGEDWAYRILQTTDGGYAVSGDSDDVIAVRNGDVWVFKVGSTGSLGCDMAAATDAVEEDGAVVTVTVTAVGAMTDTDAVVSSTSASGYSASPEELTQCEVE